MFIVVPFLKLAGCPVLVVAAIGRFFRVVDGVPQRYQKL
jgi:hypothetical protein